MRYRALTVDGVYMTIENAFLKFSMLYTYLEVFFTLNSLPPYLEPCKTAF